MVIPTHGYTDMAITRTRPVKVCSFCRSRKIKCNRGKPCDNCVKYGNVNCVYDNELAAQRVEELSARITRLIAEATSEETVATLERIRDQLPQLGRGGDTVRETAKAKETANETANETADETANETVQWTGPEFGPTTENTFKLWDPLDGLAGSGGSIGGRSSVSSVNESPEWTGQGSGDHINLHSQYRSLGAQNLQSWYYPPFSGPALMGLDEIFGPIYGNSFQGLALDEKIEFVIRFKLIIHYDTDQLFLKRLYQDEGLDVYQSIHQNSWAKSKALPLSLMNVNEPLSERRLVLNIEAVLPPPRVITVLMNRYFTQLYGLLPFVDIPQFKADIIRILDLEQSQHLQITEKYDIAKLGMLLIILRLAYVSYLSVNSRVNNNLINLLDNEDAKLVIKHPVEFGVINMAQECVTRFNPLTSTSLEVLQLGVFMRSYMVLGPEYGMATGTSESQSFNSMLQRLCITMGFNKQARGLGRNIWVHLGVDGFYVLGHSAMGPPDKPIIGDKESKILSLLSQLHSTSTKLNGMTAPLQKPFNINEFRNTLAEAYQTIYTHYLHHRKETQNHPEIVDILRNSYMVDITNVSSFCHFFIHYTNLNQFGKAQSLLLHINTWVYKGIVKSLNTFFYNNFDNSGDSLSFILLPYVVILIQRILLMNVMLLTRVRILLENQDIDSVPHLRYQLSRYYILLVLSSRLLLQCTSNVIEHNYFAWRMHLFQRHFLNQILSPDNFFQLLQEHEKTGINYEKIADLAQNCFGFEPATVEWLNQEMLGCFSDLGLDCSIMELDVKDIDFVHVWDHLIEGDSVNLFLANGGTSQYFSAETVNQFLRSRQALL